MNNLTKKILFAAYMLAIAPALTFGADRPGKTNPTHHSATLVAEPVISGSVGSISPSGGTLSYSLAGGGGTVYSIAQLATSPAPTASAIKSADTAPTVAVKASVYCVVATATVGAVSALLMAEAVGAGLVAN